jgi:tetratricopeptide (TPR) repeat protein
MLQEASKVHPEDLAQVMFYLGQAYLEKKEYNHAYTAFTAAIKEASYRAEYYYWRGNAAFAARDYRAGEDALWTSHQDYQRALEYGLYKPEVYFMYGNSLLNRAFYYMATNRSKEAYNLLKSAESKYKETIKLDPTASNAYNNLSLAYYYMNNLDKAKEALKKAIELEPLVPFFHDNLGDIYYKEAKFKEAIKEWELTLELNPDYVAPNAGLLPIPPKSPKEKIKEAKRRLS